jgi:hypothetical protein
MNDFDFKKWLFENKQGAYKKASLLREFDSVDGFSDGTTNRDDMNEISQAMADAEMEREDDLRGDMVDNVSMGVVAEKKSGGVDVEVKGWEVNILGKDHIIDADVTVYFHYEDADYVDHMEINPGGFYVDDAFAVITKLGIEDGDNYREVNDPEYIAQIQNLINKDPKLNRRLEDEASDNIDWGRMDETVGYAMITKPSDPLERGE